MEHSSNSLPSNSVSASATGRRLSQGSRFTAGTKATPPYSATLSAKRGTYGPASAGNSSSNPENTNLPMPPRTLSAGDRSVMDASTIQKHMIPGGGGMTSSSANVTGAPAPLSENMTYEGSRMRTVTSRTAHPSSSGAVPMTRNGMYPASRRRAPVVSVSRFGADAVPVAAEGGTSGSTQETCEEDELKPDAGFSFSRSGVGSPVSRMHPAQGMLYATGSTAPSATVAAATVPRSQAQPPHHMHHFHGSAPRQITGAFRGGGYATLSPQQQQRTQAVPSSPHSSGSGYAQLSPSYKSNSQALQQARRGPAGTAIGNANANTNDNSGGGDGNAAYWQTYHPSGGASAPADSARGGSNDGSGTTASVDPAAAAAYSQAYYQYYQYPLYYHQQQQQAAAAAAAAAAAVGSEYGEEGSTLGYFQPRGGTGSYPGSEIEAVSGVIPMLAGSASGPSTPLHAGAYAPRGHYQQQQTKRYYTAGALPDSVGNTTAGSYENQGARGGDGGAAANASYQNAYQTSAYSAMAAVGAVSGVRSGPSGAPQHIDSLGGSANANSMDALTGYAAGIGPRSNSSGGYPSPHHQTSFTPADFEGAPAQNYYSSSCDYARQAAQGDCYAYANAASNSNSTGGRYGYTAGSSRGPSTQQQQVRNESWGAAATNATQSYGRYGYAASGAGGASPYCQDPYADYMSSGGTALDQHQQRQLQQPQSPQQQQQQQQTMQRANASHNPVRASQCTSQQCISSVSNESDAKEQHAAAAMAVSTEQESSIRAEDVTVTPPRALSTTAAWSKSVPAGESKSAARKRKKAAAAAAAAAQATANTVKEDGATAVAEGKCVLTPQSAASKRSSVDRDALHTSDNSFSCSTAVPTAQASGEHTFHQTSGDADTDAEAYYHDHHQQQHSDRRDSSAGRSDVQAEGSSGTFAAATQRFLRHSPLTQCAGTPFHTYICGAMAGQAAQVAPPLPSSCFAASSGAEGGGGRAGVLPLRSTQLIPALYAPVQRLLTREPSSSVPASHSANAQTVSHNAGGEGGQFVQSDFPSSDREDNRSIPSEAEVEQENDARVRCAEHSSEAGYDDDAEGEDERDNDQGGFGNWSRGSEQLQQPQHQPTKALHSLTKDLLTSPTSAAVSPTSATEGRPSATTAALTGSSRFVVACRPHHSHHFTHAKPLQCRPSDVVSPSLVPPHPHVYRHPSLSLHPTALAARSAVAATTPQTPSPATADTAKRGEGNGISVHEGATNNSGAVSAATHGNVVHASSNPSAPSANEGRGAAVTMRPVSSPHHSLVGSAQQQRQQSSPYHRAPPTLTKPSRALNAEISDAEPMEIQSEEVAEANVNTERESGVAVQQVSPFYASSSTAFQQQQQQHQQQQQQQHVNSSGAPAVGYGTPSPRGSQHGSYQAISPQRLPYSPRSGSAGNVGAAPNTNISTGASNTGNNNNNNAAQSSNATGYAPPPLRPAYIYEHHVGQEVLLEEFHVAMGFNAASFGNIACLVDAFSPQVSVAHDLEFPCNEEQCQLVRRAEGPGDEETSLSSPEGVAEGKEVQKSLRTAACVNSGGDPLQMDGVGAPSEDNKFPATAADADRSRYWDFEGPSYCEPVITLQSIWQGFDSPFGCVVNLAEPVYPAPMRPAEDELVYTPLLSGFRIRFHPASAAYKRLAAIRALRRQRFAGAGAASQTADAKTLSDVDGTRRGAYAEEDGVLTWSATDRPNNRSIIVEQIAELARCDESYAELLTATTADVDHQSWVALMWQPVFCGGHSAKYSCGTFLAYYLLRPPRHLFVPFADKSEGAAFNSSWSSAVFRGDRAALSFDLWSFKRHYHVARWASAPATPHAEPAFSAAGDEDDNVSSVSACRGRTAWEDGQAIVSNVTAANGNREDAHGQTRRLDASDAGSSSCAIDGVTAITAAPQTTLPYVRVPLVGLIPNRCRCEVWFKPVYGATAYRGGGGAGHRRGNNTNTDTAFYFAPLFLMVTALQLMCWDAYQEWKHERIVKTNASVALQERGGGAAAAAASSEEKANKASNEGESADTTQKASGGAPSLANPLTQTFDEEVSAATTPQRHAGSASGGKTTDTGAAAAPALSETWVYYFTEGLHIMTEAARHYRTLRESANFDAAAEDGGISGGAYAVVGTSVPALIIRDGATPTKTNVASLSEASLPPSHGPNDVDEKRLGEESGGILRAGGCVLMAGGTNSSMCDPVARVITGLLDYYQWAQYDNSLSSLARTYCAL